jgi:hypothetical protein
MIDRFSGKNAGHAYVFLLKSLAIKRSKVGVISRVVKRRNKEVLSLHLQQKKNL